MAHNDHDSWRAKLVLHYDGRNFYGWQKQRNQRTVQGELESLLERICGSSPTMTITGAGRTDRGVHATGQVASFLVPPRFTPEELLGAMNALAPPDLWVETIEPVAHEFHPRFHATSRTYIYKVGIDHLSSSPFNSRWCWSLERAPDLRTLEEVSEALIGRHDFSAFAKSGQEKRGFQCVVRSAGWRESAGADGARTLDFEIAADRFLHHMVRYLVGTQVEIGLGLRPVSDLSGLLDGADGIRAAKPAPAEGLFLTRVEYSTQHELA